MFRSIYGYLYCIFLFSFHSRFVEKVSFDIKKVLPLKLWKKEEPPESECFSDEDSHEDDSDYEEIVIPKKRQAKIKLKASKAASSERIKPIRNPKFMLPKEINAARNAKQSSAKKSGPGHQ